MLALTRLVSKAVKKLRYNGPLGAWRGPLLNSLAAIRRLALRHVTFIAVTGSCGKTTALVLSEAVLSSAGSCRAGVGSSRRLTAETILGIGASTKFCLVELHASFPGLMSESLRLLRPTVGVVTTVGRDHFESYRSLEATAREKGQLLERLPRSGVAILNADNPYVLAMAHRTRARVLTFGFSPHADLRAMDVSSISARPPFDEGCVPR